MLSGKTQGDLAVKNLRRALETTDLQEFLELTFPPEWDSVAARILETGAELSPTMCAWAARWSRIPPTIRPRRASSEIEMIVGSVLFRVHDSLHQLWGLPLPHKIEEEDPLGPKAKRLFKRATMCGEVAVLTLTEFAYADHLRRTYPECRAYLESRNALLLRDREFSIHSIVEIGQRLDGLLHKKIRPHWVRTNAVAIAFCDDYVPMLERDREMIDHNWELMRQTGWRPPADLPDARYNPALDGLELTTWMLGDFQHQLRTGPGIDHALRRFNQQRRAPLVLPAGWNDE